MSPEMHLIVLWEKALSEKDRILADVERHVEIVAKAELSWPGDPVECFGRFYGAKLIEAEGKVLVCGGGPFLMLVVRDRSPRYGWRETSRGGELVNLRLFEMKARYREWTGGGHRVHTTNSPAETRRDIFLLTGRTLAEWEAGVPGGPFEVLPGHGGWPDLRALFRALGETTSYVVLRNSEMLPDAFDPTLHGDIDLLVPDIVECAGIMGARRLFRNENRVHYEAVVGGRPVRFDLRFVGDGYYDTRWERAILKGAVETDGVRRPAPEDAFYALVYHALYQKCDMAPDYEGKSRALARTAGIPGESFEDWLPLLEDFLARNRYKVTCPCDDSVYLDPCLPDWHALAEEMNGLFPMEDLRPALLGRRHVNRFLPTLILSAYAGGERLLVKYSPVAPFAIANEWTFAQRVRRIRPDLCVEPVFWHVMTGGGAFVVLKWMEGRTLQDLLDDEAAPTPEQTARLAKDMKDISDALVAANIVHRDIRPANMMVSPDGHVRIFDFQFAVDRDDPREQKYFVDRYMELLWVLGDIYADGHGKWNDRRAMVRCLQNLPDCPERAQAIDEISKDIEAHNRTVNLPKGLRCGYMKEYQKLEKKRRRHRLLFRKDKPIDVRRWKFLKYVLFDWGEF